MVKRISNPNHLVDVHGVDRIPDGHIVPHRLPDALERRTQLPTPAPAPLDPPPVSIAERWWAVLFAAITLAAIVYGSLR